METIQGRLDYIRFQGDNHWTVAGIRANREEVTITGSLFNAELGDSLELTGNWETHKTYGKQFKFHSYEVLMPTTDEGVVGFLESRLSNVGRARAIEMVNYFGADRVFDVILNEPERLTEIPGITSDRAQRIRLEYKEDASIRDTVVFLKQFRLTNNQVSKIINEYDTRTREVIEKNPYQLITDISGFGFKTVDEFALRMGIDHDGIERAKAGCVYVLQVACDDGNTYLPRGEYRTNVIGELNIPFTRIDEAIEALRTDGYIVVENDRIYDRYLYRLECSIASMLIALASG